MYIVRDTTLVARLTCPFVQNLNRSVSKIKSLLTTHHNGLVIADRNTGVFSRQKEYECVGNPY